MFENRTAESAGCPAAFTYTKLYTKLSHGFYFVGAFFRPTRRLCSVTADLGGVVNSILAPTVAPAAGAGPAEHKGRSMAVPCQVPLMFGPSVDNYAAV